MNDKEINIDSTEIKSSIKTFVSIIVSTITIVAFVLTCTYSIKSSIVELTIRFEKQNEMNDMRYQTFEDRIKRDEDDMKDMKAHQDELTAQTNKIH